MASGDFPRQAPLLEEENFLIPSKRKEKPTHVDVDKWTTPRERIEHDLPASAVASQVPEDARRIQQLKNLERARAKKAENRAKRLMEAENQAQATPKQVEEEKVPLDQADEVKDSAPFQEEKLEEEDTTGKIYFPMIDQYISIEFLREHLVNNNMDLANKMIDEAKRVEDIDEQEIFQLSHARNPFIHSVSKINKYMELLPKDIPQPVMAFRNVEEELSKDTARLSQRINHAYQAFENSPPTIMPGNELSAGIHNPTFGKHSRMIRNVGGMPNEMNVPSSLILNRQTE
jgi:hypothetical protein